MHRHVIICHETSDITRNMHGFNITLILMLLFPAWSTPFVVSSCCVVQRFSRRHRFQTLIEGRRSRSKNRRNISRKKLKNPPYQVRTTDDEKDSSCWPMQQQQQQQQRQLNRRERMELILDRYGTNCVWCQTPLNIDCATTDHIIPRIKGGPSWIENELASCKKCNKSRGHTSVVDWMEICETDGLQPNQTAIESVLIELAKEIEERGGQRKARPHLARQLRLLKIKIPKQR